MRRDWFVIARREFLERVRTWWFVAVTLFGPIAMIALVVIPAVLGAATGKTARVVVVDQGGPTSPIGSELVAAMTKEGWHATLADADAGPDQLLHQIKEDQIDGFLTVPAGVSQVDGPHEPVVYQGANATNQSVMLTMNGLISSVVLEQRFAKVGIGADQIVKMLTPPAFEPRHTTGETSTTSGTAAFIVGYIVMFVLYIAITLYAVNVMRSVVQEKTNRVVEIMIAAAKPRALMFGKILGVGAVGLLQLSAWAVMSVVTVHFRGEILGVFGVQHAGGWSLPTVGVDAVAVILAYFLLGYFFYASLYAAIGAMVSSDQEAQQAQTPVILLLAVPMASMQVVANDPRGPGAQVMTMLPFSSPVLMPLRYLLDGASRTDVAISLAILTLSTWGVAWLAGRIYRVGILMYGKRPSLRELARWIRYS